jgi:hypothetical protein
MIVYRRKLHSSIGKWLFAGALFVLILTVTFSDVGGINFPSKPSQGAQDPGETPTVSDSPTAPPTDRTPADAIPEPTTLLLVAAGLGTAYVLKRKKS